MAWECDLAGALDRLAQAKRGRAALELLLLATLVLAASAVAQKSVTVDEFQALPLGLAILKTGDFHLATGVGPLASVLAALPLLATPARLDTAPLAAYVSTWQCGGQFMLENAEGYQGFFLAGRLVSITFLVVTCFFAWRLARGLYGATGGLLAAAFACLSPNLLAHGALVTPDIYLTAAITGSLLAFDWLLGRPGWASGVALGVAIGAASLFKFTGVLLFAFFPLVLGGLHLVERRPPGPTPKATRPPDRVVGAKTWLALALALAAALAVINLGYLFDGSFTSLGRYEFKTRPFQAANEWLPGWLPIPLPYYFFQGMDAQLAEEGYDAYLLGQFNQTGFFHYYLVGLLVKTPLVVLGLVGLAWFCGGIRRREVPLAAAALLFFVFFSLSRHKNIGLRYLLFLEPMMAIWIGRIAASRLWAAPPHGPRVALATAVGAAWLLVTSIGVWPNYLAYFNLPSGGPSSGHKYLLDSNLDWGQDLVALGAYMDRNQIDSVDLAYFGRVRPEVYGIHYQHLGTIPAQRYAAISANLLWGRMYFVNGTGYWPPDPNTYAYFRRLRPKAVLGHTIYVFDMADVVRAD